MNAADVIAALEIPAPARVDQRVPKKLLLENGAPTASDKRKIGEGIEELQWLAALKPNNIGVPEFKDSTREYLEIAVLNMVLRPTAKTSRLNALVHRAIPYPVLLLTTLGDSVTLSLAHKRLSLGTAGAVVVEGEIVTTELANVAAGLEAALVSAIAIARQPHANLFAMYQGCMDVAAALIAAQMTGAFAVAGSPEMAAARWAALADVDRLEAELTKLRATAAKERQVARQVKLNTEIKRVQAKHLAARSRL